MLSLETFGFPCGSAGKESACNEGDLGLIPGLGRSPGLKMIHSKQNKTQKTIFSVVYAI